MHSKTRVEGFLNSGLAVYVGLIMHPKPRVECFLNSGGVWEVWYRG